MPEPEPEPRPSRLKGILERPGARDRVGRAVASLIGVGIVSIGALGGLLIWHSVRRGRLIRENLPPPRSPPRHHPEPHQGPTP